jgi:hypothetical protein
MKKQFNCGSNPSVYSGRHGLIPFFAPRQFSEEVNHEIIEASCGLSNKASSIIVGRIT